MVGLSLVLFLCLQQAPGAAEIAVVGGVLDDGRGLPVEALQLGDGGTDGPAVRAPGSLDGCYSTEGGILVRAQAEGVKLDFPSGAELLLTPTGRVHLRSGESTPADASGVQLRLGDGSVVTTRPGRGGRPLRFVHVREGRRQTFLWLRDRRAAEASYRRFRGSVWFVLGDGRVLYRAAQLGPIVALERVLCPRERAGDYPERQVVVAGDILAASLRHLPKLVPHRTADFPEAQQICRTLASISGRVFARGVSRRTSAAIGPVLVPLADGFSLSLEVRGTGPVVIGLKHGSEPVPLVEWTVTQTTRLHLVQPGAGRHGRPRYYMKGIDLRDMVDGLLPIPRSNEATGRARTLIARIGAGQPGSRKLRVSRDRR